MNLCGRELLSLSSGTKWVFRHFLVTPARDERTCAFLGFSPHQMLNIQKWLWWTPSLPHPILLFGILCSISLLKMLPSIPYKAFCRCAYHPQSGRRRQRQENKINTHKDTSLHLQMNVFTVLRRPVKNFIIKPVLVKYPWSGKSVILNQGLV